MKVAILGTRGIPNNYGGFEQFAEYLSDGLTKYGHQVYVYNSHNHPYKNPTWKNVKILHIYDPEKKIGTLGQFFYDLLCILDTRKRNFDVIIQLGYTSSSIWNFLFKKKSIIVTNMDGLEWKRSKYNFLVKIFLKFAESLAVYFSDSLIADSKQIQIYLHEKYKAKPKFIPYGANIYVNNDKDYLKQFNLDPFNYDMLVARIEPENNIEMILDGVIQSSTKRKFLVIGNMNTKLGVFLSKKYNDSRIIYLGYLNEIKILNTLRQYSNLYFHGHSVGGTNPSLLEAMASNSLICAHDNLFNKEVLTKNAFYFKSKQCVVNLLEKINKKDYYKYTNNNLDRIKEIYDTNKIISEYENHLKYVCKKR